MLVWVKARSRSSGCCKVISSRLFLGLCGGTMRPGRLWSTHARHCFRSTICVGMHGTCSRRSASTVRTTGNVWTDGLVLHTPRSTPHLDALTAALREILSSTRFTVISQSRSFPRNMATRGFRSIRMIRRPEKLLWRTAFISACTGGISVWCVYRLMMVRTSTALRIICSFSSSGETDGRQESSGNVRRKIWSLVRMCAQCALNSIRLDGSTCHGGGRVVNCVREWSWNIFLDASFGA